ncbi:putative exonuclease [Campylobacter phage vB_CjeM_WX1]|nr:putative exonuclease [Campylobacter phage vB_CjeM_WX1]
MTFTEFINEAVVDDMLSAINVANWKTGLDFKKDYKEIESHGKKALKILDKLAKGGYNSKQYYNIYSDLRDELWNIHDPLLSYKNKMPWYREELQSPELKRYREIIKDYIDEVNQAMKELKSDYVSVSHISNRNLESIIKAIIDEYKRLYKIVEKIARQANKANK